MKIARVFPRRTNATPTDDLAFVGGPPLFPVECDEVHVSVTFTYDIPYAEQLRRDWWPVAPVKIGGPAYDDHGGDFVSGMYVKPGYVITSRGCPNNCWFCKVPKREGRTIVELPIVDGYDVLDSNLLACGRPHIEAVFAMLKRQPQRARFTGGLEAARLEDWHVNLMADLQPETAYFAYDTDDDLEPLIVAGRMMSKVGISRHSLRAYVLVGALGDTFQAAERRLRQTWDAGFYPMAMLYRDNAGAVDDEWRRFQRLWAAPQLVAMQLKTEVAI